MPRFTHLHTHSHYSLLNALPKIDELVGTAKKHGMASLALTDNGNLYGAIEFYKECKKKELKPIIGVDFYVAARTRRDKDAGLDNRRSRLVLLARNEIGYKNLLKLVTDSHLEGFYYKPRIDRELMEKYRDGLIAILPSSSSDIAQSLKGRTDDKAKEFAAHYKKIFGEHLYMEITAHPEIEGHKANMKKLVEFSQNEKIPILAAHDVYYLNQEDREARNTMLLVNSHSDASDRISTDDEEDFSFISSERAAELFKDLPEALANTAKVADLCSLELDLGKWVFPDYKVESGRSYDDELRYLVFDGFGRRNVPQSKEMLERAEYELGVIKKKGYAPYFLVVADLLRFSRENGILSNIRGSVSGSLVTYLAGITNVNPIEYEIPFERFLNPDRPSPPDIDMDYADNRRDEVIEYARKKYGADKVAQIGTFGTMMARGSVRDAARAMGFPFEVGDKIAKLIPMGSQGFPMTIERAFETVPELKDLYDKDIEAKRIVDMARKIEGCARHIGVHAAGVVMAPTPIIEYTPLQFDPKGEGKIITQYDMYSIEDAGLLKFDFLGLKNLTIIADTIDRIKKIDGAEIEIDKIPVDDKQTFEMLARGETADLFQLNGDGMTRFLKDLRPSSIHDINAMVALYRPGPIQFIPDYIARKHDTKLVKYLDPSLEKILKKTYGILVYQDDLLIMAHDLAGYSWSEVDKFRKAVGKKIPEEMAKQKDRFINGCIEHSKWSKKKAEQVWKWIEPFAAYAFNKAHSVSYGWVAYLTAYLKAHYPEIYLSAVLSSESGDTEKVAETIAECKRLGIPVLPPDVNESFSQFTVIKANTASCDTEHRGESSRDGERSHLDVPRNYRIRFGLVTIKNFGQGVSTAIIDERKRGGKYRSLADFLDRVKDRNINKKSLESLIKAGALDCFGEDRGVMMANIELLLEYNKESGKRDSSQDSLFGLMADSSSVPVLKLNAAPKAEMKEKLGWEKELLGLYISGHPLEKYREVIAKKDMDIKKALENKRDGDSVILGIIVNEVRTIQTKNNETMAFVTIADFSAEAEAVVFPRVYKEFRELIAPDRCLAIKATVNSRNGEKGFVIERMKSL
ncbi:DNA polymerase III subunit alpha [Patescibacteria group bacterium]|nr:DNA polymerase III subunit alpha [Patescibacteria group bacterium]MDE1946575.1 DNA polymerase III subunit alpha [Patescibacteria group bacterium]MDE2010864.1 DNA polymerase III subunit alpha [Patescibacteria group bacterium]MDE2232748.1 DNA polymerase III subunit alpha [Patescibacteria group bacterium]